MGPNTVPWGTPDKIEAQGELCPRKTTGWYWFDWVSMIGPLRETKA